MTDNIQNGEGARGFYGILRDQLYDLTKPLDMSVEQEDHFRSRVRCYLAIHEASTRPLAQFGGHSLAREPATADVDAAIAIVRQHAARIGVPSITVAAAMSSEPAIAEGERDTNGEQYEKDYTPGADKARMIVSYLASGPTRNIIYAKVRDALNEAAALAQSSTPPASKGVEGNPLSLETSDLDPITPEEDAVATAILAAVGWTRQSHDTVVRAIRAGLAKAGAVIVPGWQPIETAPRDGTPFIATLMVHNIGGQRWRETHVIWADDETGEVASDCEHGWTSVDDYEHWMPLPSAHSIQSGGEGGAS